jgi:hypothetical protein
MFYLKYLYLLAALKNIKNDQVAVPAALHPRDYNVTGRIIQAANLV